MLSRYPAERRRRSVTLAAHGCCCCCCLHSIGGIAGALLGGRHAESPEARRTVRVYWISVAISLALGVAGLGMQGAGAFSLLFIAVYLPLAQLNASFLTLCAKMFMELDLPTLGRITWKSLLWAVIAFILMVVPFVLLARLNS